MRKKIAFPLFCLVLLSGLLAAGTAFSKERPKPKHPFDVYDHPKHFLIFAQYQFACTHCHTDPASFTDRTKINRFGCHICHQAADQPAPAPQDCTLCHEDGKLPRPDFHDASWIKQHQNRAKAEPKLCESCHRSVMFCVDCHQRRDQIQRRFHNLNWRLYHSIEARANPHTCDACHRQNFCVQCHGGTK